VSLILGIETSCDECSVSVVDHQPNLAAKTPGTLLVQGLATYSQIKIHQAFGGVVPEVASRNHLVTIHSMLDECLGQANASYDDLDAIAVTNRPGLVGALLVGVTTAKTLAYTLKKPLIPVHHLEGHICSIFLDKTSSDLEMEYPLLVAVVSGGHTNLYVIKSPPEEWGNDVLKKNLIAQSRDDAAGEAFDKTAKLMGFSYPGGMWIDKGSVGGNKNEFKFTRALPDKKVLDFSFSGLKTAVSLQIQKLKSENLLEENIAHLCASVQEAIVDMLWNKMSLAIDKYKCRGLAIVGGVSANSRLRDKISNHCKIPIYFPQQKYCTDNAAMIAAAGAFRFLQKQYLSPRESLKLNAYSGAHL